MINNSVCCGASRLGREEGGGRLGTVFIDGVEPGTCSRVFETLARPAFSRPTCWSGESMCRGHPRPDEARTAEEGEFVEMEKGKLVQRGTCRVRVKEEEEERVWGELCSGLDFWFGRWL